MPLLPNFFLQLQFSRHHHSCKKDEVAHLRKNYSMLKWLGFNVYNDCADHWLEVIQSCMYMHAPSSLKWSQPCKLKVRSGEGRVKPMQLQMLPLVLLASCWPMSSPYSRCSLMQRINTAFPQQDYWMTTLTGLVLFMMTFLFLVVFQMHLT